MHHKRTLLILAVGSIALFSAACGDSSESNGAGDTASSGAADRTVNVEMVDIAFTPTELSVAKGETVRFVFANEGKVTHEALVGTPAEQKDHEKKMAGDDAKSGDHDMGGMGGGDDDKAAVTVEPGEKGDLTHRFDEAGTFEIGCHEPGHYDAGMKITVTVT